MNHYCVTAEAIVDFLTNRSQLLSDFLKISKEWFVQANSISSHFAVYQLKKARKKNQQMTVKGGREIQ